MNIPKTLAIASLAVVLAAPQAWALAGGGFAPGGPLSANVSPSCNGYNMDGTPNLSAGATEPGCLDQSLNGLTGIPYALPD